MEETEITKAIVKGAVEDLLQNLEVDVAIAGGGPSGLVAARYLAAGGAKVALFERSLSVGGGMWGGGMMFPKIVVQEEGKSVLDEFGVKTEREGEQFVASSVEAVAKVTARAVDSGAHIFNGINVEDVMIRKDRITGFVVNWGAVERAQLHVDPLAIRSKFCVDATGHAAEVCNIVCRKVGKLNTPSGGVAGERSMWAERSEALVLENTKEVYPGLYVTGMAANAVFGAPRMGPIFGGMFLSGKKVADLILGRL